MPTESSPASFFRRLGAICYDSLILLAILMLGTWVLMPFTGGAAISPGKISYQIYLILICLGYFAGFWAYSGQTVGMRAWQIKVVTMEGDSLTWQQALTRCWWGVITLAPGGLGLWVCLFHPQKQSWYDILAHTKLIRIINR